MPGATNSAGARKGRSLVIDTSVSRDAAEEKLGGPAADQLRHALLLGREKAVDLSGGLGERTLHRDVALEGGREIGIEDGVDLAARGDGEARLGGLQLVGIGRVVGRNRI